jgi:hypothetical protein
MRLWLTQPMYFRCYVVCILSSFRSVSFLCIVFILFFTSLCRPLQESNLNTQCYPSAYSTSAGFVSTVLQVNLADPGPSSGTNSYLLTGSSATTGGGSGTSGYATAAACLAAVSTPTPAPTTATAPVAVTAAALPTYTSSCEPLVSQDTGVAVAGYYTKNVLSSVSQVPGNGYVAALVYKVSGG